MNKLCGDTAAILLLALALVPGHRASAIELQNEPSASATIRPAGLSSSVSGVVSAIDASGGTLTLDGRRYSFVARTLVVRRQNDASRPASVADITVGSRVSLTLQRKTVTSPATVSEVWFSR